MAKRSDDDEFERAMMMLDVKPSEKKKRPGKEPAAPEVVEDVDFDAAMRALPDGRVPKAAPVKDAKHDGAPAAPAERVTASDARYAATAEEAAEFLTAMAGDISPIAAGRQGGVAAPEGTTKVVGSVDVEALRRKIGRGQLEPDAVLDLHGNNRQQALARLERFVAQARSDKWRVVRIIVGKGLHSEGGDAVVGPAVERWLRDGPALEILKAPAHLGGGGALIAILRF